MAGVKVGGAAQTAAELTTGVSITVPVDCQLFTLGVGSEVSASPATGATLGGVPLILAVSYGGNVKSGAIFYLINPPTGVQTLAVSGGSIQGGGWGAFYGVTALLSTGQNTTANDNNFIIAMAPTEPGALVIMAGGAPSFGSLVNLNGHHGSGGGTMGWLVGASVNDTAETCGWSISGTDKSGTEVGAAFSLASAPTVDDVDPYYGDEAGGTDVTITGTGFVGGADVTFDGVSAAGITFVSDTEIICTTPAGTPGWVDVVVTNPDLQSGQLEDGFLYTTVTPTPPPTGTLFLGRIASIRPSSGLFDEPATEIEVQDWMGYLAVQELGIHGIRADWDFARAIREVALSLPIRPESTDATTVGVETFDTVFDADDERSSAAAFLQKMCRNELGRAYLNGQGELIFENRDFRPLNGTSAFTLDGTLTELKIAYLIDDLKNIIEVSVYPREIDAAATTTLWSLQGAPKISHGQTLELLCVFTDPDTGRQISAIDVIDPVTVVEFGSVGNFVKNDMAAFLDQDNQIGGNAMLTRLTNLHPDRDGYLNDFQIQGKGIYLYSPIKMTVTNEASVSASGKRRMALDLDQISDPNKGRNYAAFIKNLLGAQHLGGVWVSFCANETAGLMTAALNAEIGQRFSLIETATGMDQDFFINRLKYAWDNGRLDVDVLGVPCDPTQTFIWDSSHWDNAVDAKWGL